MSELRDKANSIPCPYCKAGIGEIFKYPQGMPFLSDTKPYHKQRYEEARKLLNKEKESNM